MHRSRHHAPLICHCEEAAGRRGNLGKAVTILPGLSCNPAGYCEIATAPSGLAMTRQGGAAVHQRPCAVELSRTRRSLSAATGPVGTGSILTIVCAYRQHCAGRGMPRPSAKRQSDGQFGAMHRSRHHAPLICHCEEAAGRRGNLGKAVTILPGLSCNPAGYCEIATAPSGLAMTRQGGAAVHQRPCAVELSRTRRSLSAATGPVGTGSILTIVCAYRQHCAGRGMPLPYNGVCGRRWCPEICSCQWRSLTAATDAIGLYVLSAAGTNRQCLREIATGAKRPRNDNLGGHLPF